MFEFLSENRSKFDKKYNKKEIYFLKEIVLHHVKFRFAFYLFGNHNKCANDKNMTAARTTEQCRCSENGARIVTGEPSSGPNETNKLYGYDGCGDGIVRLCVKRGNDGWNPILMILL